MGKVFNYTVTGKTYFSEESDEYMDDSYDFQYEVSWQDLKMALTEIIVQKYFSSCPSTIDKKKYIEACRNNVNKFIFGSDIEETLIETMEEDLKDYFEEEAMESLEE